MTVRQYERSRSAQGRGRCFDIAVSECDSHPAATAGPAAAAGRLAPPTALGAAGRRPCQRAARGGAVASRAAAPRRAILAVRPPRAERPATPDPRALPPPLFGSGECDQLKIYSFDGFHKSNFLHDRSPTAARAVRSSSIAVRGAGGSVELRCVFGHCCAAECGRPWGSGAAGVRTGGGAAGAQPRRRRPFTRRPPALPRSAPASALVSRAALCEARPPLRAPHLLPHRAPTLLCLLSHPFRNLPPSPRRNLFSFLRKIGDKRYNQAWNLILIPEFPPEYFSQ